MLIIRLGVDYSDPDSLHVLNATTTESCVQFDPMNDNIVEVQDRLVQLQITTDFPSGVIFDVGQVNIILEDDDSML